MALASITDRAIENQLQGGFAYDPKTGDERLDTDLKARWLEISEDPRQCDPDGERNVFHIRAWKRAKQTRGITAYAPLFDVAGYHDDVQFLNSDAPQS